MNIQFYLDKKAKLQARFAKAKDQALQAHYNISQELVATQADINQELSEIEEIIKSMGNETTEEVKPVEAPTSEVTEVKADEQTEQADSGESAS